MRGHHVGRRAPWSTAAVMLALATFLLAGANAPWGPVANAEPAAALVRHPAVDGLTTAGPVLGATGSSVHDWPTRADSPEDAFGWRSAWSPPVQQSVATAAPKPKPARTEPATTTAAAPPGVWWKQYEGRNHVWMPTLGINRAVYVYPCSRSSDPDNLVYRWGCAGTNNVYLLGHAYGVFKALHDAYSNGKLKKGMPVVYADGSAVERLYRVTEWRIVSPVDSGWAVADQSRPSMTLQTCIGPNASLRLNVRLVAVDR